MAFGALDCVSGGSTRDCATATLSFAAAPFLVAIVARFSCSRTGFVDIPSLPGAASDSNEERCGLGVKLLPGGAVIGCGVVFLDDRADAALGAGFSGDLDLVVTVMIVMS